MRAAAVLTSALLLLLLAAPALAAPRIRPVVLWHGMGDNCCHAFSMGRVKHEIEKTLPGVYVYSVEVGNSTFDDTVAGCGCGSSRLRRGPRPAVCR